MRFFLNVFVFVVLLVSCKPRVTSASDARKVSELCQKVTVEAMAKGIQKDNIVYGKYSTKYDRAILFINHSIVGRDNDMIRKIIKMEAKKMSLEVEIK
jgi:hypothetical protein